MRATDIAGYTFQADNYHPGCVLPLVRARYPLDYPLAGTIQRSDTAEDILRTVAKSLRLEYGDAWSYDSDDFPKVIFVSDLDGDVCGACGEEL